jgi:metallo-beta-lactamase class B
LAKPGSALLGAQVPAGWSRPTEPSRIVGNVYWVGTHDLSSYLITSPEGHIVINTALADSVSLIRANIERLGFRISDVKILTATHAHWDHVAGLAALKEMTGARVYRSAPDADVLESGGKSDFRWGKDPQAWFDPVAVDRRLEDGETIRLGGTRWSCTSTPGTPRVRRASRSPCARGPETTGVERR